MIRRRTPDSIAPTAAPGGVAWARTIVSSRWWARYIVPLLVFLLVVTWLPGRAVQAAGTDEIRNYSIDILPQEDGSLVDTYAIQWCVISNAAGPLSWFTLGMPAEQYQIVNYSGEVASARPVNEGFDYKLRIDLPREVNAGECIDTSVQVHQYGMAYLDESTNEISFQFTPGWFNEIPVDLLRVTWHLPAEQSLLKSLDPKPTSQDAGQAVWETDLQPGEKYPITVVYDRAAFPGFGSSQDAPTQAGTSPGGSESADSPFLNDTEESGPGLVPGFDLVGIPLTATTCICLCLVMLVILFVIFVFFRAIAGAGRIYRGGSWLGGYPRGGGWLGGGGGVIRPGGGGGSIFTPRKGGGSGSFGGRGMSCACVSSGCACACAGGGRAGCSRKGFDVSNLFKDRREEQDL